MLPISTHKYEPLDFSSIKPLKHIYAMYFVWFKNPTWEDILCKYKIKNKWIDEYW
jgi:hypothetical protein